MINRRLPLFLQCLYLCSVQKWIWNSRGSWKPYLHAGLFSFIRHALRSPRHILEGTSHCQPGSGQMGRKNRNYPSLMFRWMLRRNHGPHSYCMGRANMRVWWQKALDSTKTQAPRGRVAKAELLCLFAFRDDRPTSLPWLLLGMQWHIILCVYIHIYI